MLQIGKVGAGMAPVPPKATKPSEEKNSESEGATAGAPKQSGPYEEGEYVINLCKNSVKPIVLFLGFRTHCLQYILKTKVDTYLFLLRRSE